MKAFFSALCAAWLLTLPAGAQSPRETLELARGVEPVSGLDDLYVSLQSAYASRDAAAAGDLYSRDAQYLQPGDAIVTGRAEIRAGFERFFGALEARGDSADIVFKIDRRHIDGATAADVGYYRIRIRGGDDRIHTGKFVVIAHRDAANGWRFAVDAFSPAPADAFPEPSAGATSDLPVIPFTFLHHIFLDVVVNGLDATFLYDPIRNIIIDRDFARANDFALIDGVEAGYGQRVTTGGAGSERHEVYFTRNVSLHVGGLAYDFGVPAVVPLDSMMASALGRHADGLLGINLFEDYIVEFDFERDRFVLHPPSFEPPGDASVLPITWMGPRPTVPLAIMVEGTEETANFLLDFGMGGGVRFTTRYTNENGLADRLDARLSIDSERGLGGALSSLIARLPRLRAGANTMDSVVVSLAQETEGADANPQWDGLLGLDLLSRFDLYLDLPHDRLWLRPNGRFDRPAEYIDTGIEFAVQRAKANGLTVQNVEVGSPADDAGFEAGDEIVSVGNRSANDWHRRQWREALERKVGAAIPVEVQRNGRRIRLMLRVPRRI